MATVLTFNQLDPGPQGTVAPNIAYKVTPVANQGEVDLSMAGSNHFAVASNGIDDLSIGSSSLRIYARDTALKEVRKIKLLQSYTIKVSNKIYGACYNGKNDTVVTTENDGTGHYCCGYDKNATRLWQTAYSGLGACRSLAFDGLYYYTAVNPTKTASLQKFFIDFINRSGGLPVIRVQKTYTLTTDFQSYYGLAFNGLHLMVLTQSTGKGTNLQLRFYNTQTFTVEKVITYASATGTRGIDHDGHAIETFQRV